MSEFTLLGPISELERFTTDNGEFVVYLVGIDGEQGRGGGVRHKRKSSSPEPKVGEVVDGELIHGKDGPELKRIWKRDGNSGGSRSGGGSTSNEYRTPAQIMRGYAHSSALQYLEVKHNMGTLEPLDWKGYLQLVDGFYNDIRGAS